MNGFLSSTLVFLILIGLGIVMGVVLYFIRTTPVDVAVLLFTVWTVFVAGVGISIGSSR